MIGDQANTSPFYIGRTMYGGAASNYALNSSTVSCHMGPNVKPVNRCNQNLPLSSTAKRILDALEQFSTPVMTLIIRKSFLERISFLYRKYPPLYSSLIFYRIMI